MTIDWSKHRVWSAEMIRAEQDRRLEHRPELPFEMRQQIWRRRQLASVTFGIELRGVSVMLATDWHRIAQGIDRSMGTCDPLLDEFWVTRFSPMTTKWIHDHPLLDEVAEVFDRYRTAMRGCFDFENPRYKPHTMRSM